MTGCIQYEGPSMINGAPVVVVVTDGTRNRATGQMLQQWILPANVEPHIAAKTGEDEAVCGDCVLRGTPCYVVTWQAPLTVWRAYKRNAYGDDWYGLVRDRKLRLGAYGDPAALPHSLIVETSQLAAAHLGYTQRWLENPQLAPYLMASVHSVEQARQAQLLGWRTYRTVAPWEGREHSEAVCPKSSGLMTCERCMGCGGAASSRRASYVAPLHGIGAKGEIERRRLAA